MLQGADRQGSQEHYSGTVRVKLLTRARPAGSPRWSDHSLYSEANVTFEEDAGAYDQTDGPRASSSLKRRFG